MVRLGVVSVQGAFMEHEAALRRAVAAWKGEPVEIVDVRRPETAEACHGLVLPGGESTTISRLLDSSGLRPALLSRIQAGVAVLGTCAGAILLSSRGDDQVQRTGTSLLGVMDIGVRRNAFGRQRESFEAPVRLEGDATPFPGVFIRAPAIAQVWGRARPVAWMGDEVVGVKQGRLIALAFHPELSPDPRLHLWFLQEAAAAEAAAGARALQT